MGDNKSKLNKNKKQQLKVKQNNKINNTKGKGKWANNNTHPKEGKSQQNKQMVILTTGVCNTQDKPFKTPKRSAIYNTTRTFRCAINIVTLNKIF